MDYWSEHSLLEKTMKKQNRKKKHISEAAVKKNSWGNSDATRTELLIIWPWRQRGERKEHFLSHLDPMETCMYIFQINMNKILTNLDKKKFRTCLLLHECSPAFLSKEPLETRKGTYQWNSWWWQFGLKRKEKKKSMTIIWLFLSPSLDTRTNKHMKCREGKKGQKFINSETK